MANCLWLGRPAYRKRFNQMLSKISKGIRDVQLQKEDQISFLFAFYDPKFVLNQQEFQKIHATDKSHFCLCSCVSRRSCSHRSKYKIHSSPKSVYFYIFKVKPTQWAKQFTQVVKRKATHTRQVTRSKVKGGAWQLLNIIPARVSDCFLFLISPVAPLHFRGVSTTLIAPTAVAVVGIIPATPSSSVEGYAWAKLCKALCFS